MLSFTNKQQPLDLSEESIKQNSSSLAVIKNSVIERYLVSYPLLMKIKYFDSGREALQALEKGEVDAYVGEKILTQHLAQQLNLKEVVLFREVNKLVGLRLQMTMDSSSSLLHSILNKSLASISYDLHNDIMAHWFDHEPFKNSLNGVFSFNRIPYTYTPDSGVGLEYSIIQHLLETMGYELGQMLPADNKVNSNDLLNSDDLDFMASQALERGRADSAGKVFYSEPYLVQKYRLISRVNDPIIIGDNGNTLDAKKKVGAVIGSFNPIAKKAIQMYRDRFRREVDEEYFDLDSAIEAMKSKEIDYLLVDYREYKIFVKQAEIETQFDAFHSVVTRFSVPLTVAFKDEVLRDKFNVELEGFTRSFESRRLEKVYEASGFQKRTNGGVLMADIITYLIHVGKLELLNSVMDAFNFSGAFAALSLQIGSDSTHLLNYKNINGHLTLVDSFSRQGLTYFKRNLVQGKGIEAMPYGQMTIYFEPKATLPFQGDYIPPLSVFESFNTNDFDNISEIYHSRGVNSSSIDFTAIELDWIENNPVVRVGIDPADLPYEGVQDGEFQGIIADILDEMSRLIGIKFEPVIVSSWQSTLNMLKSRQLDMFSAAVEHQNLSPDYLPGDALFTDQLGVVGHIKHDYGRGLESMADMKIGLKRGAPYNFNLMETYPEVNWVQIDNSEIGLRLLNEKKIDAYIDTTYAINYLLNEKAYRDLIIVDRLSNVVSPTFHTLKSKPILGSIVAKAIHAINASKKQQFINNWATNRVIEKVDYTILLVVVLFSLLALAIFFESNRRLKRQMAATSRAESEDHTANQAKSAFLANMSHEIRIPMNAIIGMSHLALEEPLNSKARNYVTKVHRSAQSLLLIINDILDISKIESGNLELEQRSFFLRDTLRYIVDVLGFKVSERNLQFVVKVDGRIPRMLIGDELRLSQVLINLGNNAIKFTHQGHVIIGVSGRKNPDDPDRFIYHFYVEDTGIGITPDKLDGLFDSFKQADASITRKYGGTGLGLSISKQLIHLMGGNIWVESELGKGSTFHFEVELEVAESNSSLFRTLKTAIDILSKKQLFMLEPDAHILDAANVAFVGSSIETHTFTRYLQLVEELKQCQQKAVVYVADVALKREEVTAQLCELKEYGEVVLSTSVAEIAEIAHSLGVNVLQRPWLQFEFITTLSGMQDQDSALFDKQQKSAAQHFNGQSILLVEDNELNQELVLGLLEPFDLNIEVVENGLVAVEKAYEGEYSLILMDIQMPVLGGYEAVQCIREFDSQTPIVAMTANVMVEEQKKALQVGMNDFIPKPIDVERLISVIERFISEHQVQTKREDKAPISAEKPPLLFDPNIGLKACAGNEQLLLKLLDKFFDNSQQRVANLIKANEIGDRKTAIREAHTMKSTAATIGVMPFANLCAEFEKQMRQGSLLDEIQIEQLKFSLVQATTHCIDESQTLKASNEIKIGELDKNIVDQLDKLEQLLKSYDLQAVELIQVLKQQTNNSVILTELIQIEDKLSFYQFEPALELLQQWKKNR